MSVETLLRPPSLVDAVCQRLAGLARSGQEGDDGWLPTERELSVQLGVSRSVVREAAKRLELQGLVEIHHGLGIRAVECLHKPIAGAVELQVPDPAERLRQLVEVRLMIEPANARAAALRASPPQIEALHAAHQALVKASDAESAVTADLDFHGAIAAASGNRIALLLVSTLSELLRASVARSHRRVTTAAAIKQHAQILAAIVRRDANGAAKAMERHLLAARTDLGLEAKGQTTNSI